MLSDFKLLSGGSTHALGSSFKMLKSTGGASSKSKSSLFTVDSLLAPKDLQEFNDLSPPATPPSPSQASLSANSTVLKPLPVPDSPIFHHYPFAYPGNFLMPGLPFPSHPAAIHTWPGFKFPSSLTDGPPSKSIIAHVYVFMDLSWQNYIHNPNRRLYISVIKSVPSEGKQTRIFPK